MSIYEELRGSPDECGYCHRRAKGKMIFVPDGIKEDGKTYGPVWACNTPSCGMIFYDMDSLLYDGKEELWPRES